MKNPLLILLALIFLTSCTVQKRRYNNGFHVEWFGSGEITEDSKNTPNKDVTQKASELTILYSSEADKVILKDTILPKFELTATAILPLLEVENNPSINTKRQHFLREKYKKFQKSEDVKLQNRVQLDNEPNKW